IIRSQIDEKVDIARLRIPCTGGCRAKDPQDTDTVFPAHRCDLVSLLLDNPGNHDPCSLQYRHVPIIPRVQIQTVPRTDAMHSRTHWSRQPNGASRPRLRMQLRTAPFVAHNTPSAACLPGTDNAYSLVRCPHLYRCSAASSQAPSFSERPLS